MAGQLIVSVSGISDRTLADVEAFCGQLNARNVPVSLLVAPRLKGGYRLDCDAPTVEWLAEQREHGHARSDGASSRHCLHTKPTCG